MNLKNTGLYIYFYMLHYSIPLTFSWIKDEPIVWRVCWTSKWVLGCLTRSAVCSSGDVMVPLYLFLVRKYIWSFSATWFRVSYLRIPRKLFTWTFLSSVYSSVSKPFVHYHTHKELSRHFFPNLLSPMKFNTTNELLY